MGFKSLAKDFVDWVFFENSSFLKFQHTDAMQNMLMEYPREFYKEMGLCVIDKIESFYQQTLIYDKTFHHKSNHQVMMLLSLLPYCDFDHLESLQAPVWLKDKNKWELEHFQIKFIDLDKFMFKDPKRVLLLTPIDEKKSLPFYISFMGTHPHPSSPGWQVGICADSNPFLNFGELILRVFESELLELIEIITHVKKSPIICTGHSLGGALCLLLYQKAPQVQIYALNPPRFVKAAAFIAQDQENCVVYVQKGDLLQQVGLQWPSWSKIITLQIDDKEHKIRPVMAHCRCFSAEPSCVIKIYQGDPHKGRFHYAFRAFTTVLWQLCSLPFFLLHSFILLGKYVVSKITFKGFISSIK